MLPPGTSTATEVPLKMHKQAVSCLNYFGTKQAAHFQVVLGVLGLAAIPYSKV